ncbi:hypothetical protein QO004_004687 [Rhizobium mesoamericanum]|uniref:hypothetical protein n=1 Tax=Rhizobium mesoamericanum TaxID=1079800 RepID=UPI00277EF361|nr:hypothetical protein [Rhizobium mesoamericanum]MDQ0562882.1 hypothetical protein [Rhizobium mesoamericanum]
MLTPVRAASNASLSSQGQTAAVSTDGLVRAASTVAPVHQIQGADLNSSAASKLNILLLAVRARMVDALLDVLNAASEALSIPPDEDEADLAFASRLAAAIQKLQPANIEQVERQLAMQGHAVPLRLLAEALRNPAGPEAARVTTYLETVRYKDRDLAARAVVSSYGQNDASPLRQEQRTEISIHWDNLAGAARAPVETKQEPKASQPQTALAAAYLNADDEPVQLVKKSVSVDKPIAESAVEAAGDETFPKLGEVLLESVASEEKVEAAAHETLQADMQGAAAKGDPIIPKSWAAIPASLSDDTTKLIVTIIRDQETEALFEAAEPDPAVEIDIILDEAILTNLPEEVTAPPDRALPVSEGMARQSPLVAEQLEGEAAFATAKKHPAPEVQTPLIVQQAIDETYVPVLMKIVEGVPFATQPYEFSKDEADDSGAREMYREDHNGGEPSEEDAEQQGQPSKDGKTGLSIDDEAAETPATRESLIREVTPPHRPAPPLPMATSVDDAYSLYRRKVDWE